jgi:hypothetical protein
MRALGPGAAGLLIAYIGPAWNFGLQALLYLGVAIIGLMIRATHEPQSTTPRGSAWSALVEGARFVVTHPVARMMLVLGLVPPLLLIPSFSALMPVFAVDVFHGGPEALGLLLSAVGVGGVVGGVLAAWLTQYDRVGYVQTGAILAFAAGLVGFAYSPTIHLAVFFLAVAGMAEMVHATLHVTTLQMCATAEMRGRIASLLPLFPAFISVGSMTSGAGADAIGPALTVLLTALGAAAIAVGAWLRSRALREVTLSGLVARAS